MAEFLKALKKFIEEVAPALAVVLWNYEESKVQEAKDQALDAQTQLQEEKNHESVDAKYAGKSDLDIVNDAISEGSGAGQSDKTDEGHQPGSTTAGDPKK